VIRIGVKRGSKEKSITTLKLQRVIQKIIKDAIVTFEKKYELDITILTRHELFSLLKMIDDSF